ncbi:MAG: hypothetical protein WCP08_00515 [Prolixibacteraceae bacterium]
MKTKYICTLSILLILTLNCFGQASTDASADNSVNLKSILFPAIIAAIGYIIKLIYETIAQSAKNRRLFLEEKLKNFYWPILTRLEQNSAIWTLILKKRDTRNEIETKIAVYVEEHILLKNHREIMTIIINNRYYAKFDKVLSIQLRDYFKHVAIYEGIIQSKENTFPGLLGAPYPEEFDEIIKKRTEWLQKQLDGKMIF